MTLFFELPSVPVPDKFIEHTQTRHLRRLCLATSFQDGLVTANGNVVGDVGGA